ISTFCRIPSIITSTMVGDAIGEERYLYSIIVFAITGAVGVGGYFLYHYLTKKASKKRAS
ncbi:MAG: TVP38/TMEM64 family protein, partial [Acutalibacteraceae bacterium]